MQRKTLDSDLFRFHPMCEGLRITPLSLADDLLIFTAADIHSVLMIKEGLNEFKTISGLAISPQQK